jgi:hypothetical protein
LPTLSVRRLLEVLVTYLLSTGSTQTMRVIIQVGSAAMAAALLLSGCQQSAEEAATPAAATPQATWPASLPVFGDGFPNPGDACRRVGESAETANYLDHTATLAGCLSADDAAKLGGNVVATVEGVTLVSVPAAADTP